MPDWLQVVLTALGGAGIGGIIISTLVRAGIDTKIKSAQMERETRLQERVDEYQLSEEYRSAVCSYLFWLNRGVKGMQKWMGENCPDCKVEFWNGELASAWTRLNEADLACKKHNRKLASKHKAKK